MLPLQAWLGGGVAASAAMSASASPSTVTGSRVGGGGVNSSLCTCTPSGGTPPYTYFWISALGNTSPNTPTASTSTFHAFIPSGTTVSDSIYCLVTDSLGASGSSGFVGVELTAS